MILFHEFWDKTLEKYRNFFKNIHLSIYTKTYHYINSYLIDKKNSKQERIEHEVINCGHKTEIDSLDAAILTRLSTNARIPIIEIARQLQVTSTMVRYRINKLKKQKNNSSFSSKHRYFKTWIEIFHRKFPLKRLYKAKKHHSLLKN